VFPDFVPPQVVVQTEAPGLSAEQVELLVTRPLEAVMNGAGGLESIRSQSIQGLSIVTAVFDERTEVYRARQVLSELLSSAASALPEGVQPPRMTPMTSATMDLLKVGLCSDTLTPQELRGYAQWTLRPRLLSVPGVANVSLFGGELARIEVQVRPERLAAHGLSIADVVEAARGATGVRGAGFVEGANQRIVVRTEGQASSPEDLARVVVARRAGASVRLGDVADVVRAAEPKFGDALIQGRPGVLVTMLSQYGANTVDVTRGVEAALDGMKPALAAAGITLYPRLHRPATFVEHAVGNLSASLALGAALVVLVLFLFLYNLRTAFISLTAIPLSLGAAVVVLHGMGATLNTITLGGLAIALGEVVDDAIIDVENVFRRLRENRASPAPRPAHAVVLEASLEVRSAVVYATFVVALVFLPVITMSGLQGRMFAPLGEAYILATLASLLVALTVTPALCLLLLPCAAATARELPLLTRARDGFGRLLEATMRRPRAVLLATLLLCAGAGALLPGLRGAFLPEFREGHFVLHVHAMPGTSLPEMRRIGAIVARKLLDNPHVATVEQQIGRAELGEDPWGPNRSEFHVELAPLPARVEAAVEGEIRAALATIPGIRYDVLTFLGDRIGETLTGETAAVVVSVYGEELDALEAEAARVRDALGSVPGAVDVQQPAPPGLPEVEVRLRPERLEQHGLRPLEVLDAVETAFGGRVVAQTWRGNRIEDVAVILAPQERRDPESVGRLRLASAEGAPVPLSELAWVQPSSGRSMLLHDGGRRRQTVTCNVEDRDVTSFVAEARALVDRDVRLAPGHYVEIRSEAGAQAQARRELLLHSAVAALGIVLLISMVLGRARNVLLVFCNLPFALVGGVVAAWLSGRTLSLGSLVGFVTLFGITTRNSIMLLSHFEHLVRAEGCAWGLSTAVRGARERFVPILMTSTVTALALLPLAVDSGAAGREIEGPMAAVILGGLVTSSALNLIVLPSLALRFGRFGGSEA
jgi:CzcA family heavy metal efflux pump